MILPISDSLLSLPPNEKITLPATAPIIRPVCGSIPKNLCAAFPINSDKISITPPCKKFVGIFSPENRMVLGKPLNN